MYNLFKNLTKVFSPKLFTQEHWTYLDVFLPMVLPVLDIKNNFERVQANHQAILFLPYLRTSLNSSESNPSENSKNIKRSAHFMPTTTFVSRTVNFFEEYYDFTTSAAQPLFDVTTTNINTSNKKR